MIKSKQQTSYNNKNHCKEISNTNKNYYKQTINTNDYQYSIDEEFNNYKYYIAEASEKYFITQNKGHDKLFKEALKNKTDFIEFIKHFISIKLANELTENNIEIYDRKFITNDFLEIESDIIYKVKNKSVYFIIEHQSTIDKNMAYRMFEYMTEIIKEHIQDKSIKSKSYPKIIPIVINTNNRKWNAATKYSDNEEKIEKIIAELSKKGGKSSMPSALERFMLQERQEGKQEGKEEGRKQTLIEIIKNMINNNIPSSKIAKITGLSEEEIKKLQTEQ